MAHLQESFMDEHSPKFFNGDRKELFRKIGQERLVKILQRMLLIRNFETRAEAAYQQGKIGGFFHSYIGQEAIQTASVEAMGEENWWVTSYRCHALALLLGATPNEIMAELYGRITGNAKGRGGSMHLYTKRLLGGFGIVGGQLPIATGAAFTLKYTDNKKEVAVCYLGDGAVAQGAFHESLNLASLWQLPCIFVIENNKWGMGTAVNRALTNKLIAEEKASGYNIKGYTFDGMDFIDCYAGFKHVHEEVLANSRPVLIEVLAERFKGHSISDPGLYRSKEQLKNSMTRDPISLLQNDLLELNVIDEAEIKKIDKECRESVITAMKFAEESPWPDPHTLEKDVFAPEPEEIFE
ncbi:Pyruvate dehydrogenase E1 component subunit alpha [Chlamydiales bacterium STE3]|nr:Pyruvate dehydrogenase E1 component subunit alpha [Chlamydiales bacterium STE3]